LADNDSALPTRRRGYAIPRLAGEFIVIVVGVLVALAADRWNEERNEAITAEEYLVRVGEEIRADSVELESWFARSDRARAVGDSLRAAMSGTRGLEFRSGSHLRAAPALRLPPIVAWEELSNTGALRYIRDTKVRRALSQYYAARVQAEQVLSSVEDRSRYPYFDVLYRLGLMDGSVEQEEWEAFLDVPGGIGLVNGVGGYLQTAGNRAQQVLEAAARALAALAAARVPGSA